MNYGDPEYNKRASRAMDTVQDKLERDLCGHCGRMRKEHANGQGIQPKFIRTDCPASGCPRFQEPRQ